MRNHRVTSICRVEFVTALALTVLAISDAAAWQRPATPCPCTADGSCYPQGPWGFTGTKWRPWPGDVIGQPPTPAEEAEERERLKLEPFELPTPEKEDQRGPKTTKRPKAPRGAAAPGVDQNEAPEPEVPLPGDIPLPGGIPQPGGQDQGGVAVPDDFGFEPPAAEQPGAAAQPKLQQPPAELEQPPAVAPAEEAEEPQETEKPAEPQEDFDPFSQLDEPRPLPKRTTRTAVPIELEGQDAPPALPASLRKMSKSVSAAPRARLQASRFVHAAAIVE